MRRRVLACWGLCWAMGMGGGVHAQAQDLPLTALLTDASLAETSRVYPSTPDSELPEVLAQQRRVLSAQREVILAVYEQRKLTCWQKFAVNPCLSEARRARRQALEPIQEQELALNAQERVWRTEQRDRRLQNKSMDKQDKP